MQFFKTMWSAFLVIAAPVFLVMTHVETQILNLTTAHSQATTILWLQLGLAGSFFVCGVMGAWIVNQTTLGLALIASGLLLVAGSVTIATVPTHTPLVIWSLFAIVAALIILIIQLTARHQAQPQFTKNGGLKFSATMQQLADQSSYESTEEMSVSPKPAFDTDSTTSELATTSTASDSSEPLVDSLTQYANSIFETQAQHSWPDFSTSDFSQATYQGTIASKRHQNPQS